MAKNRYAWLPAVLAGLLLVLTLYGANLAAATPSLVGLACVNRTGANCDVACGACYTVVQDAIDAVDQGGEVRIAGGHYTDPAGTVMNILQSVSVSGGWNPSCSEHEPELNPTVLDASGNGSVVTIASAGEVGLYFLILTGGDGTDNCSTAGCGGGIFADNTVLHLHHSTLVDNLGGRPPEGALGGGLYGANGEFDLRFNQVLSNTAGTGENYCYGGGVYIGQSGVELVENEIADNLGSANYSGSGGVHLYDVAYARVLTNTIRDNVSNQAAYWSGAGGIQIDFSSDVLVSGNLIEGNSAGIYSGLGGGIYVSQSAAELARNVIVGNTGGSTTGQGDALSIRSTFPVQVYNNLIADNYSGYASEAVYVERGGEPYSQANLTNNTFLNNGDRAVVVSQYAVVTLTNNIMAGHNTAVAVTEPASSTLAADTNICWNVNNPSIGSNTIVADPLLRSTFHPGENSPALNAGVSVPWLTDDLAGDPRPQEALYDIGALEGARWDNYLPTVVSDYPAPSPLLLDHLQHGRLPGWTANRGIWINPGENMVGYYRLGNAWNIHDASGANFSYEGTVTLVDGNAAGLVFRSSADGNSSYDAIIDAVDNEFKFSFRSPYQVLDSHAMTIERNRPYRIRVEAYGNMLFGFLDGVHLLTASDPSYSSGQLGVLVFQATAVFDHLEAWSQP